MGQQSLKDLSFVKEFLVPLTCLFRLLDSAFHHLHVGHDKFQINDVNIPQRIGAALDMDYIAVVKAANHVYDGICHPDIGQELVAQAFAPAGTLHQTGDVHEFDHGGSIFLWTVHFC